MSCPNLLTGWGLPANAYEVWTGSAWQWDHNNGWWGRAPAIGTVFATPPTSLAVTVAPLTPDSGTTIFRLIVNGTYDGSPHSIDVEETIAHPGVGGDYVYVADLTGFPDVTDIYLYVGPDTYTGEFLVKDITIAPCPTSPTISTPPTLDTVHWYLGNTGAFVDGCAEYGTPEYGSAGLSAVSYWIYEYRPNSVTIKGPGLDDWFAGSISGTVNITVIDQAQNVIGSISDGAVGTSDSYTVPLVFGDYDFSGISIQGSEALPLSICSVTFGDGCTAFWTNHVGQQEVNP